MLLGASSVVPALQYEPGLHAGPPAPDSALLAMSDFLPEAVQLLPRMSYPQFSKEVKSEQLRFDFIQRHGRLEAIRLNSLWLHILYQQLPNLTGSPPPLHLGVTASIYPIHVY